MTNCSNRYLQSTLFEEYRIESKNNNEIAFEISLDNLLKALKSGQLASDITLKLTKLEQNPFLRIAIDIQSVPNSPLLLLVHLQYPQE